MSCHLSIKFVGRITKYLGQCASIVYPLYSFLNSFAIFGNFKYFLCNRHIPKLNMCYQRFTNKGDRFLPILHFSVKYIQVFILKITSFHEFLCLFHNFISNKRKNSNTKIGVFFKNRNSVFLHYKLIHVRFYML